MSLSVFAEGFYRVQLDGQLGSLALRAACFVGHVEGVRQLLDFGVDPNMVRMYQHACTNRSTVSRRDLLQWLLTNNTIPSPTVQDLYSTMSTGDPELVKMMLDSPRLNMENTSTMSGYLIFTYNFCGQCFCIGFSKDYQCQQIVCLQRHVRKALWILYSSCLQTLELIPYQKVHSRQHVKKDKWTL
jgi:hypothetical protein